ncbi:uncharacterized mitochondrial protein AtMg00810-like [Arachis duranensis]|uniref:Uncharacterized mitochondrial protein AtMg00810-like n=1 Tax=Arachis duranensis TaxID=130453 RepID=A0A6P4C1C5_ARADU|nr:uncharacterized mitochondrial protein AtMg00810-like [Arachis duranensis]
MDYAKHLVHDDMLVTGNDNSKIMKVLQQLYSTFLLNDLGDINFFLGIETLHFPGNMITLNQFKYIFELLSKSGMQDSKRMSTPIFSNSKLTANTSTPFEDPTLFLSILGGLQYVTVTRPDIAFSVNKLSQFMANPMLEHWNAVKRILIEMQIWMIANLFLVIVFIMVRILSLRSAANNLLLAAALQRRNSAH